MRADDGGVDHLHGRVMRASLDSLRPGRKSAFGAKRTWTGRQNQLDRSKMTRSGPRCGFQFALHQTTGRLLDHLVGAGEALTNSRRSGVVAR
jgi:hypothetical protein